MIYKLDARDAIKCRRVETEMSFHVVTSENFIWQEGRTKVLPNNIEFSNSRIIFKRTFKDSVTEVRTDRFGVAWRKYICKKKGLTHIKKDKKRKVKKNEIIVLRSNSLILIFSYFCTLSLVLIKPLVLAIRTFFGSRIGEHINCIFSCKLNI